MLYEVGTCFFIVFWVKGCGSSGCFGLNPKGFLAAERVETRQWMMLVTTPVAWRPARMASSGNGRQGPLEVPVGGHFQITICIYLL